MSKATSIADSVRWFSSGADLRTPMVACVDANQRERPHVQILAAAATLVCLSEAVGLDPHDIIKQIHNAEKNLDSAFASQFQAMRSYARGELL